VLKRFAPIIAITGLCWIVFLANTLLGHGQWNQYGIIPRHLSSLPGIIWAPFLHGSYRHLAANTVPLLILGLILCARSKGEFIAVTSAGVLVGGGLTWLLARNAVHIGASGLIFSYFGYLASLAWFDRKIGTVLLSLVCLVAYGGMIRGVFPTSVPISWEGHLAGLMSGIAMAWLNSKLSKPSKEKLTAQPQLPSGADVWR